MRPVVAACTGRGAHDSRRLPLPLPLLPESSIYIPGAQLLPLLQRTQRVGEIDLERPVVAGCRSGTRSAQAVVLLQKSGFKDAANLAGGMLRWRAESCAVAGGGA